jgi:hypothetical protein
LCRHSDRPQGAPGHHQHRHRSESAPAAPSAAIPPLSHASLALSSLTAASGRPPPLQPPAAPPPPGLGLRVRPPERLAPFLAASPKAAMLAASSPVHPRLRLDNRPAVRPVAAPACPSAFELDPHRRRVEHPSAAGPPLPKGRRAARAGAESARTGQRP